MSEITYRVKDWNDRFESAKSRTYKIKSQTYMPNKVGIGYIRIMREHDGAAVYGAWCAVVCLLSRMEGPRHGYLTDTGRATGNPHGASSLSMLTMIHADIVQRMLNLCSSKDIGWLEVMNRRDTDKDTIGILPGIAGGPSPLPLPSPSPLPSPIKTVLNPPDARTGKIENHPGQDKYERLHAVPQAKLAQWAAEFCGDEPSWIRAYNAYIAQIGPEAFRSILAQFVGEVGAGEDGKRRGAVLVAKVKKAIADKRKAVSP